ncbi:MFS transporter [Effusibacillus pohliae]|uniref:MFS transporter n=1 Tax=Effusibacillus pohliae TaxID=232270 RepID=UPI00037B0076|nr:MFS transporter [Effusibacillus pohliae]
MDVLKRESQTQYRILWIICAAHFLQDLLTSVVPAMLPVLQQEMSLNYAQLGIVVMVANLTASFLQPGLGYMTDKKPVPWLLPLAALFAGLGLTGIAYAHSFAEVLLMVVLIGLGSATFHPEASRVAHLAAGSRKGLAQSIFQVGGNAGQAFGPLMISLLLLPFGLKGSFWLLPPALLSAAALTIVARWYKNWTGTRRKSGQAATGANRYGALALLVGVVSIRSWIHIGIASFLPLYYINILGMNTTTAEVYLFVFLLAGAIGTFVGGPLADRFSKRSILLFSMVGAIPFILLIPHLTGGLALLNIFVVGFISLCSFAVTVVYAQELVPGKIGMVSGLMIGFAIGAGGIGAAVMGYFAKSAGLATLIELLLVLPVIGWLLGSRLPKDGANSTAASASA